MLPDAGFAWGDRYEIGYRDRGNGWMIGILDGPTQQQSKVYGMTPTLTGTTCRRGTWITRRTVSDPE